MSSAASVRDAEKRSYTEEDANVVKRAPVYDEYGTEADRKLMRKVDLRRVNH